MRFSLQRALLIARREYLTTVRRKAFIFTLVGMPLYFGFIMYISVKPQLNNRIEALKSFTQLAVVDSSGLFANASHHIRTTVDLDPFDTTKGSKTYDTDVTFYDEPTAAQTALRSGKVSQVLVVPPDYLSTGKLRRYVGSGGVLSSTADRPVERWLVENLLAGFADSIHVARVVRPSRGTDIYSLDKSGQFVLKDDRRELFDFIVPFMFAMLLGVCIVIGGQYLLQGVAEEKESRILESLLCTVTAEDLMVGKLIGLGGAGLTMVAAWMTASLVIAAPSAAAMHAHVSPMLLVMAVIYFVLGYLFYGSLMTGIGAMTNNMREAQQFAFAFTFANFLPAVMLNSIMSHPNGPLPTFLSMFPPTAPVSMMLRLALPSSGVPPWQIALSIAILAATVWLVITGVARVFRIGLLMYGKTPNLPEILRWARSG